MLAAALLRLYGLDREGFWGDEYLQTQSYPLPLHLTIWHALSRHGFGPPDFIIGWFAYRISPTVWMCRLPSAIWGVVAVFLIYRVGSRMDRPSTGWLAAALLCFCRMHIALSQEVRPYAICLASILLTLCMLQACFARPGRVSLAVYFICAVFMTTTRSFIPCVFLFSIGVACSILVVLDMKSQRREINQIASTQRRNLRRVWFTTLGAGIVAAIWVGFMLGTAPQLPVGITRMLDETAEVANPYGFNTTYWYQIKRVSIVLLEGPILQFGTATCLAALLGAIVMALRWRAWRAEVKLVALSMLLAGPTVALIYSAIGGTHKFYPRYSFFMMPVVAIFAAFGAVHVCRVVTVRRRAYGLRLLGAIVGVSAVLIYPVTYSLAEPVTYRRIDWRGAAAALKPFVGEDAAVMTLSDKAFGLPQRTFFGKYEWDRAARPLGESVWTFATSDSHFERLMSQKGICVPTVAYDPIDQGRDQFMSRGLRVAPAGFALRKFRDLDVLVPSPIRTGGNHDAIETQVLACCDALLSLPLATPTAKVAPLALKSRVLLRMGRVEEAGRAWEASASLVPGDRRDMFDRATVFADTFRGTADIPPTSTP